MESLHEYMQEYRKQLVSTTKGADAIIESIVIDHPDFRDLDTLTHQIERATVTFIQDVERFLAQRER